MKYVEIDKVKAGMILAEPIYNEDGTVELLGQGAVLTDRHIKLLDRLGITVVRIADPEMEKEGDDKFIKPTSASLDADTVEKAAREAGRRYDVETLQAGA